MAIYWISLPANLASELIRDCVDGGVAWSSLSSNDISSCRDVGGVGFPLLVSVVDNQRLIAERKHALLYDRWCVSNTYFGRKYISSLVLSASVEI